MRMDPFEGMAPSLAQQQADAQAALNAAEADAAALLAELDATDAAKPDLSKYQMPPRRAPGEPTDPVKSVAAPSRISAQAAAELMFKPVGDTAKIRDTTLPMTHTVDFAAKIKAARKDYGSH